MGEYQENSNIVCLLKVLENDLQASFFFFFFFFFFFLCNYVMDCRQEDERMSAPAPHAQLPSPSPTLPQTIAMHHQASPSVVSNPQSNLALLRLRSDAHRSQAPTGLTAPRTTNH